MELTVIGSWAPYPRPGEACSGYLIKGKQSTILLDCGHGVASQIGGYIDINLLQAICISHFHPDHYVDLYALRHFIRGAIFQGKRQTPLDVYLPSDPPYLFQYFDSLPELNVMEIKDEARYSVGDAQLHFLKMNHAVTSFAVKVTDSRSSIFYSGDTSYSDRLEKAAMDVDLLVLEASLFKGDQAHARQMGHMTTQEAALCARNARAGRFIATHFWPEYNLKQVEEEISEFYGTGFYMAGSGLKVKV